MVDTYGPSMLNNISIEEVDSATYPTMRKYWATPSPVDVNYIAFKAQVLLLIQKGLMKPASSHNFAAQSKQIAGCSWN